MLTALAFMMVFVPQYKYGEFPRYVMCVALGIMCANSDFFGILKNMLGTSSVIPVYVVKAIKLLIYILLMYEMERLREGELKAVLLPVFDAIIPVIIIGFFIEFVNPLPVVGDILKVFGKYSMNIFLIHNFIRVVWYYDFTYSFKYAVIIVFVLLGISLLISVCLEWVKKLLHFNQALDWIVRHVVG